MCGWGAGGESGPGSGCGTGRRGGMSWGIGPEDVLTQGQARECACGTGWGGGRGEGVTGRQPQTHPGRQRKEPGRR